MLLRAFSVGFIMKYLVLILDNSLSRIERAVLCCEPEVDLVCHEVLSPPGTPLCLSGEPSLVPALTAVSVPEEPAVQTSSEWDECQFDVDMLFPDSLLDSVAEDALPSPSVSPASWLDLGSYDSDVDEENSHFSLDYPAVPGEGCMSCDFHRVQTGESEALCSLCYMRQTYHCIYSEYFLGSSGRGPSLGIKFVLIGSVLISVSR